MIRVIILLISTIFFSCGLARSKYSYLLVENIRNNIVDADAIRDLSVIQLDPGRFNLILKVKAYDEKNKQYHAARIAAFTDDSIFDQMEMGKKFEAVTFLRPGTGMAPSLSGRYEELFISRDANHYVIYNKNDTVDQRADLIKEENGLLTLNWSIRGIRLKGRSIPFGSNGFKNIFLAIVCDNNLNETLDEGEFKRFKIVFN